MRKLLAVFSVLFFPLSVMAADGPPRVAVLFDTDLGSGIDNAFALGLILASHEFDLRGITTVGAGAEDRAWMACRFLSHCGRKEVPVAFGRDPQPAGAIDWQIQYRQHPAVVWNRTAKPVKQSAVELMYETLKADPGKITIIAVGPLTNVARLLAEHPDARPWIGRIIFLDGESAQSDAAAIVFVEKSGAKLIKMSPDASQWFVLNGKEMEKLFSARTSITYQMQNLYELWESPENPQPGVASLAAAVAVASALPETIPAREIFGANPPHDFPARYVNRVSRFGQTLIPKPPGNESRLVDRGNFPNKVHVVEDFETDIEKRWWMTGKLETKDVPPGSTRACRAVLTQDYDDRQGDTKAFYRAVIFNPVPGPPMGKNTRLAFQFKLHGTDTVRVQLFSLSQGYHRYLSVKNLPQDRWTSACVDMTQMRRPDGSGGVLSEKEDERIDDIQFYIDPRAELLIDDIILYDAADDAEKRPFPKRILFTAWFDTGKQGVEWPGTFEIVPHEKPLTWKAAKAVVDATTGETVARIGLRGTRPLPNHCRVRFRYRLDGADAVEIALVDGASANQRRVKAAGLRQGAWAEADIECIPGDAPRAASRIDFIAPKGSTLLLDDVVLYEPQ